jgi:superfamily II RNA helicase
MIQILNEQPYPGDVEEMIYKFPYTLDPFQKHANDSIRNGRDTIVCVPTSSGKTLVAKMAIFHTIKTSPNKRIALTVPVKALADDIYENFKQEFFKEGITVGIMTGDKKIDIDSTVVILTAEILRNTLINSSDPEHSTEEIKDRRCLVNSLGCVIMDEIHYTNDPDRGSVWEETIMSLPEHVQLVGLSATVSDPKSFVEWIVSCHNRPLTLIISHKRIVPLHHNIYVNGKYYQIMNQSLVYSSKQFHLAKTAHNLYTKEREQAHKSLLNKQMISDLVVSLKKKEMLPTIFFSYSRNNCEDKYPAMVHVDLIDHHERAEIEAIFNAHMVPIARLCQSSASIGKLKDLLMRGVGYHHSGMLPPLKNIVQILFNKKLIKVLFATETLSVGVNMPTRTVVFLELEKYTDAGKRFITTAEYRQASGRAGRRGLDVCGDSIIAPMYDFPDEGDLKGVLVGSMPAIQSKFKYNYRMFLNVSNIEDFVKKSLINKEYSRDIEAYSKEIEELEKLLVSVPHTDDIVKLYKLEHGLSKDLGGGLKVSLNKIQFKELSRLKRTVPTGDYAEYINNIEIEKKIKHRQDVIDNYKSYTQDTYKKISRNLTRMGYEGIKALMASQINVCNSLLLTECIYGDLMVGLMSPEIVALLSIFVNSGNKNIYIETKSYTGSIVSPQIGLVEKIREKLIDCEEDKSDFCDWELSYEYVELAYNWASGLSMFEMLSTLEEHEGNFVKNILKIREIVQEVISVCKLVHKHEILPELEKIENLLIRDIVSIF